MSVVVIPGTNAFDVRLAELLREARSFTADDLTDEGDLALDPSHAPNGRQNGIGSFVRSARSRGLIEPTGAVVKSRAPRRKGGVIRVWRPTLAGIEWALEELPPATTSTRIDPIGGNE